MKPGWFPRILLLILAPALLAATLPQGTPPPPTPTLTPNLQLAQVCGDLKYGECVTMAIRMGWGICWPILFLLLVAIGLWVLWPYLKGWQERIKKIGEEDADRYFSVSLTEIERTYLEQARKSYRYFKFRGLPRARAEGIEPPRLDRAYISLCMLPFRTREQEQDELKRDKTGAMLESGPGMRQPVEPIDLTAAIRESQRLAIIGAAGSGKSTLLQWAGLACACARLNKHHELSDEQREFIEAVGVKDPPFPLLIPLRAFDNYCSEGKKKRTSRSLVEFMSAYFQEKSSTTEFKPDFFLEQLKKSCLLMFDGMDEVDPDNRPYVRAAVEEFLNEHENPGLRCLITSRDSAAYVSDQMAGFRRCDVQPLSPGQRDQLIHLWYSAVLADNEPEARRKADDLCSRIASSDSRVQELAITPLMVTIFAMVHYSRDELPQQRAKLYEDAVEVILSETLHKDEYAAGMGLEWETRRDRLMRIAFELQERHVESLLQEDLVGLIWQRFDLDEDKGRRAARSFLLGIADRGGLLEERNGLYGFFTHATFREYLAGRYLAEAYSPEQQEEFFSEHLGDDRWYETVRLAAGYLAVKGEEGANRFIRLLAGLGDSDEQRARALVLAGQSLAEMKTERRLPQTVGDLTGSILPLFSAEKPKVKTSLRNGLGLALGALGDPRLDPLNPATLPVPGGEFRMGTSPEDEAKLVAQGAQAWDDEKPDHTIILSEYSIGKYPVTNLEFKVFWGQQGYEEKAYWSPDGWLWRTGKWESDLSIYSEESQKTIGEWLARRPVELRNQPFWWDIPQWNAPNLPVVRVCWFEAEAYCNWLSAVTGRAYALPTEAQWEKAARGHQAFLWPWADEWDADRCNTDESPEKVGSTTPVGMYPHGASPYGALDMAGNIWEWCSDWYDPQAYARRAGSAVTDPRGPESGSAHVLRGGSWYDDRNYARCAYRLRLGLFFNFIGFRLVLSPI